jgi:GNAT superfamily N-acetyltransferase
MDLRIERATPNDVMSLLGLYTLVYGRTYPLAIGTNPTVMLSVIKNPDHLWLVVRDERDQVIASLVAEQDVLHKIGRLQALVVHPDHRRLNLGSKLAEEMVRITLGPDGILNSLYTTTRTVSIGPQAIFLNLGFVPLGVFPNAHRVKEYETLTLLARFREGVLAARPHYKSIPEKISPILEILNALLPEGEKRAIETCNQLPKVSSDQDHEYEIIYAPDFVKRKFFNDFQDPYDRFYPFHEPNLLASAKGGGPEIYAYYSQEDGYCTIIGGATPFWSLNPSINSLIRQLLGFGVSYIEMLMSLQNTDSLKVLLDHQFLPSAVYPAMTSFNGELEDFVLLSRTAEPLNFRGMAVDHRLKPYIDQFVRLWSQMHFETLEVIGAKS